MQVSVVIPTIGRKSLNVAIGSVKSQSHEILEILIVDDSLSQSVVSSEHLVLRTGGGKGVSYARNLGSENAKGDFLAFLDDDDVWQINKIQVQIEQLVRNDLDVLISSARVNRSVRPAKRDLLRLGQDPLELLYGKPHILKSRGYLPTASYFLKRSVFERVNFREDLIDRENLFFLASCFRSDLRISQSQEVLIEINYDKKNSLGRISLQSEQLWFDYLESINFRYAQNFLLESSRNFVRQKDYVSAKKILANNMKKKPANIFAYFMVSLASIFS